MTPGRAGAELLELPEPPPREGTILVEGVALGVCATDREIAGGAYGSAPPGREHLVLGHESLGRIVDAPADSELRRGDLVAGIVRHPDPVPCPCCAVGRWDECRNGRYTERGIKQLDGFGAERWRSDPAFCVPVAPALEAVGVLVEPTSIVAKAWETIDTLTARSCGSPRTVLVTGAGPIGLLAALLAVERGLDTHVLDIVRDGPKPELVAALGATYHSQPVAQTGVDADIIVEATGVDQVVVDAVSGTGPGGIVCLTGVSSAGRKIPIDAGAVNRELVLENDIVFGSVNAAREHYVIAAAALARADRAWLEAMITRREPVTRFQAALERQENDVKTVIDLAR
ncbi:MAG TPA: glucose 1-dehydrogenase [Solirubrobacteraceae bacterium]|nr:glucose 1-dehydrogenase [Solirubrobacteraceae bacterium]